jgi:capsid protein
MDRNDSLCGAMADRRVDNIVQQGFSLEPKTGDKKLDLDLWQRWEDFANDPDRCDIAGELTWKEIERHACRAESIDGDIVVAGTQDGPFQMIESHLIRRDSRLDGVFLGVESDQYGKRKKYHLMEEVDAFGTKRQVDPIDVRDKDGLRQLFHIYNPKRVYMTRGVTILAPIFSMSGMLEDINFAKLVQQQMVSMWAILHEYAPQSSTAPPITDTNVNVSGARKENGRQIEERSPGMEYHGEAGETLKGFSPNIPNSEYFQQVRLIMQILGVNFGLPLCLVLMDGSETNFSGWRGAVDEARKGFVADQLNLVRRLNKPAYEWWLTQEAKEDAALRKYLKPTGKIKLLGHIWHPPTWSYIEPVADAEGDATQLRNALTSPRRLHAARSRDWEEVSEEIIDDNLYAIDNAAKKAAMFNADNPTSPPITWRDLIPLVMPSGQTMALQDPGMVEANQIKAASEIANQEKAGAEMVGVKRADWKNMRKAVNDILSELSKKTITEKRARLELDAIGVPPAKVNEYITDALDGSIENPELQEVAE